LSSRLTLTLSVIAAVIVVAFHLSAKRQPSAEESKGFFDMFSKTQNWQGRYAPDFKLELINGEEFNLSETVGKKVIVLNFFATWCGPCREEMPELVSYYGKHRHEPFLMIGIDADEKEKKVEDFILEHNVTFPVGIDRDEKIQKLFGVTSYPTTVFIGTDGTVKIYEMGPVMNADVAFDALLNESLELIKSGNGIDKETYLAKLKEQAPLDSEKDDDEDELSGRAKTLAEEMACPCGCSDKVIACGCNTADGIKERLRTTDYSGKTDAEVIRELNKEFCVGSVKG
jgi:peroxiredoxin